MFSSNRSRASEITVRDWDDAGSQTWTARERIKTVTCVAISDSGKWLAVGESGYSPRVLLYSTTEDVVDTPTSIVSDHAIGVKSVAFSPDGRYLATLGNLNDGFVFIWNINQRTGQLTLQAVNKCTTNICHMMWCGQSLITVGTRHVKVWTVGPSAPSISNTKFKLRSSTTGVASPGPATLLGRNALLGSLVDCIFTSVVAVDSRTVILTTDTGHLCYFQTDGVPEVQVLKTYDFGISSVAWQAETGKLILGGCRGLIYEEYDELLAAFHASTTSAGPRSGRRRMRSSAVRMSLGLYHGRTVGISAVGCLSGYTIALDTDGNLQMESSAQESSRPSIAFASHNDLIQGVQRLPEESGLGAFYTWSRRGELKFWDARGAMLDSRQVELDSLDLEDDNNPNELRVARFDARTQQFVLGDRLGIAKVYSYFHRQTFWTGRAHGAEVTDLALHDSLVASSSRDRMVQVFNVQPQGLELVQTLDDHIGAVNRVLFSDDGSKLLSSSADRTVVVRERAQRPREGEQSLVFLSMRVITLRSTPLSMAFAGAGSEIMLVSTGDRHVARVDCATGIVLENFKVTDPENDDTVALNSICVDQGTTGGNPFNLLMASSPTDKSIRIFDADKCALLTREAGHTEGVSDLCLLENREKDDGEVNRTLVSTGLDGTIMIWSLTAMPLPIVTPTAELSHEQTMNDWSLNGTPTKASPATLPPLRKILSKMEAVDLARSHGPSSPGSPRSLSPPRVTRKKSHLALTSTIDEESIPPLPQQLPRGRDSTERVSPPESPAVSTKPKKQRSRSAVGDAHRRRTRSPSPSAIFAVSTPTTPRRTLANNGRLRRPPSVPSDLRDKALAQRRQSTSQSNDFGSLGMATEQASRMLKTYRKKLMAAKEEVDLVDLEGELEQLLKVINDKKVNGYGKTLNGTMRRSRNTAPTEGEMEELAVLLDRTNMADRSPTTREGGLKTA